MTKVILWAYFVGGVALELILDALIAYFTGGSSLVAKASAKISRLTAKAEQLGAKAINFGKGLGKKVANSAKDLYKWLEKEFLELIEAIKSGNFAHYLKKKFYELTNDLEGFVNWLIEDGSVNLTKVFSIILWESLIQVYLSVYNPLVLNISMGFGFTRWTQSVGNLKQINTRRENIRS